MAMVRRTEDDDDILIRPPKRLFKLTPCSADPASKIDRISSLPDEVLVSILSLLTFEEAGFTRLLSKRWINLWFSIPLSSFVVDDFRELRFFNTLMKHSTLGACKVCPPLQFHCFTSLKSLSIKGFKVSSRRIDKIFSHCPVLEHLNLTSATSRELVNFKAVGTNLQLKHLEVYDCGSLRNVEIHAPNLVSFRYEGPLIELSLACGDQFVDVYFNVQSIKYDLGNRERPIRFKSEASYLASQFKAYTFQLKSVILRCKPAEVKMLPTFSNLTKLVIFLLLVRSECAIPFTSVLKVAPLLKRLELHYIWRMFSELRELLRNLEGSNWEHVSENAPHQRLREVLLSGFRGLPEDMELSMYLLHNAVALENFTIDPCERSLYGSRWERYKDEGMPAVRKCAKLLLWKKPQQVKMLIL